MSEDRTSPMRTPGAPKPRRDPEAGDQETVSADRDSGLAPTINMPGGAPAGPGFVRATPFETPTPPPQRQGMPFGQPQPPSPYGPGPGGPGFIGSAPAGEHTMVIGARATPVFAWLVVVDGPDKATIGKAHTLHPDLTTVGRAAGNTVVLADQTCSSQHFRVRLESQEGTEPYFVMYDMGSRNGTFVGDKATYKKPESQAYRHVLKDGDYLLVGETTLVFKQI